MTNHDRFAGVFESRKGRTFSTAEIEELMQENSDIAYGSILPNDHGNGNNAHALAHTGKFSKD